MNGTSAQHAADAAPKTHEPVEPIAIAGLGCRWSGGVRDLSGLWELLRNKRSGYKPWSQPRFDLEGFHHPNPSRPGSTATQGAFLLDEDARLFDEAFFGMNPREVETMDPSQRKLLEVVYEAFESAGVPWDKFSGSRTGVFVGNFSLDQIMIQGRDSDHVRPYATTGMSISLLSNRISYIFNLNGPSVTLDTACSSSMYALHMAVAALRNGDCDGAIVAASNWILDPGMQLNMSKLGALSPTSKCHTFDAAADGYARGEGFAALYLTRASVAVAEGLPIRAFVRGTAINANGRTGGITHPSPVGQEAVIRKAYENAGNLDPASTSFFECHGTGTPVGDPIEVAAIGNVFAPFHGGGGGDGDDELLPIGSVKTNLGHTESASALAGIMKVMLAMDRGVIPPSIGVETLNPNIDFAGARVRVLTENTPWPEGKLRRASLNSFGYGGANGHCIVDHVENVIPGYVKPGLTALPGGSKGASKSNGTSNGTTDRNKSLTTYKSLASSTLPSIHRADAETRSRVLLPFSAHKDSSLRLNMAAMADFLSTGDHSLADVAYTLGCKRSRFTQRACCIVPSQDAAAGIRQALEQDAGLAISTSPAQPTEHLGFVFTGQGAQWPAMGAELFQYAAFAASVDRMDQVLGALSPPAQWGIRDVLTGADPGRVLVAQVSQAVCTAVQVALVDLLRSWGVRPSATVGHSSGEMAAAYAAGRISAAEAIAAAYYRGVAVAQNKRVGAMLAVGLGPEDVLPYLEVAGPGQEEIRIAAINSPKSVTLSGEAEAVDRVAALLAEAKVFARKLDTGGNAYHSHHMEALGPSYEQMLDSGIAQLKSEGLIREGSCLPRIPWYSSVHPHKADSSASPAYWRANLESPVRFSEAVARLVEGSPANHALIEIGPHPALKTPVSQILQAVGGGAAPPTPYSSCLRRKEDGQITMLQLAGVLFGWNYPGLDLGIVNSTDGRDDLGNPALVTGCTAVDLPPYQYSYGPVNWYESRFSREYRGRKVARHDLLGYKLPGNAKLRPQWRNVLRIKDLPWLQDHRLIPYAVFPAAGYLAMAIECASQSHLGGCSEGEQPPTVAAFAMRNVSIKTALRIPDHDYGVEVLTTLELDEGSTAASSSWASFTISSVEHGTDVWVEHCIGQVRVELVTSPRKPLDTRKMDARTIDMTQWYSTFAKIGLGYGPTFQGLSAVDADPALDMATATVHLDTTSGAIQGESTYPVHPASLDSLLQLGLISCHGGQIERARTAFVPIHIDRLWLKNGGLDGETRALGTATGELRGLRGAYVHLQLVSASTGEVVLEVPTLRCISYVDGTSSSAAATSSSMLKPFSAPLLRLAWKPDIRTMDDAQAKKMFPPPKEKAANVHLFPPLWRISSLIVAEVCHRYGDMPEVAAPENAADARTIHHFIAWAKRRLGDATDCMAEARGLTSAARVALLEELHAGLPEPCVEAEVAMRLFRNMEDIVTGRRAGLDVMLEGGLLTALYQDGLSMAAAYLQLSRVFEALGHANPNMRILELGAGTGGATRVVLKALGGGGGDGGVGVGIKRYRDFTFTDISSGFLATAKTSFAGHPDMHYATLNIEQEPAEQGFEPVYDVVVASQVLHATASMARTLRNVRKLLRPGGRLVLVENVTQSVVQGVVLGTLTGYWDGAPDGRVDSPFMSLERWNVELDGAGFSGTEQVLEDYPEPHTSACTIVSSVPVFDDAKPAKPQTNGASNAVVHMLYGGREAPGVLLAMAAEMTRRGVTPQPTSIDCLLDGTASLPDDKPLRIVASLNEENLLLEADEARLGLIQTLARRSSSMMWVVSCGLIRGKDPRGGVVMGLLRTIGTENPTSRFRFVDVDPCKEVYQDPRLIPSLVELELGMNGKGPAAAAGGEAAAAEDREFVYQDGCLWVSRLVPDAVLNDTLDLGEAAPDRVEPLAFDGHGPVRAAFATPGLLTSLYFKPDHAMERSSPLPDDQIQVKVAAVGLNWKDLAMSAGRFDADALSSEFSGVVDRVGAGVTGRFSVGDRVFGLGKGHFGNYVRTPALFAQRVRPGDDLVEVATMPLVYMTAVYAFERAARVRPGDRVLVQSATGGLGLAAVRLARAKGAEVFCTVGTADKARFLRDEMAVPASHIFSSRVAGAENGLPRVGPQQRFDVILCTVSGDAMYEALQALAPLGTLVDVGRLDVQNSKTLGLELLRKSASFASFDLSDVADASPETAGELMASVSEYLAAGVIGPIKPFTTYDVSRLDQALLSFSKGTHIGKLVVTFQNPSSVVSMVPPVPVAAFKADATYLISGGLGGLGRSIIAWMAERGARDVVVLSRSGPDHGSAEVQTLVENMAARGVRVEPEKCDVSVRGDVDGIVSKLKSQGRRVAGVVHAAMSLQDISFDKLTARHWRDGLAAKVQGTYNLHEATLGLGLDFFVMTTSLESVLALATQSAYTAATNFQEMFARFRRRQGLPASTASFGLINDVGSLSRSATTRNMMARNKAMTVSELRFLQLLEPAFRNNESGGGGGGGGVSWAGCDTDPLSAAGVNACLDPAVMAAKRRQEAEAAGGGGAGVGPVPRWQTDARVSLVMRATEDAESHYGAAPSSSSADAKGKGGGAAGAVAALRREFDEAVRTGGEGERDKTEAMVSGAIAKMVAEMLFIDASSVDSNRTVAHYGVDSLIAAELRNWLHVAFGFDISMLDLLDTRSSMTSLAARAVSDALESGKD